MATGRSEDFADVYLSYTDTSGVDGARAVTNRVRFITQDDSTAIAMGIVTSFETVEALGARGSDLEETADTVMDITINEAVRRPYRGITIKPESFASIAVVTSKSSLASKRLKNSSVVGDSAFTSNFLINSVSENRQEKHQPVSTFGKDYVYFFGEQPRQITFNCTLLNTENFRWEEEWWYNYEESFRGTRLASRSEELRIKADESIIYGYMISCSTNKDSNNPHSVTMSFTIHVTEIISTRGPGKIGSDAIDRSTAGYGYVDLNVHDPGSDVPTITIGKDSAALRQYNLQQYIDKDSGWLSRLSNGLQDFGAALANVSQDVINFMYGRNIVLPADTAYNEFASGNPQFAEGTDAHNILFSDGADLSETSAKRYGKGLAKFGSGKSPTFTAEGVLTGSYTDNYDEYPYFSVQSQTGINPDPAAPKPFTELVADFVSSELGVDKNKLLAGDDMILDNPENEFLAALRVAGGAAAFTVLNVGAAQADSSNRTRSSEDSSSQSYPNEAATSASTSEGT